MDDAVKVGEARAPFQALLGVQGSEIGHGDTTKTHRVGSGGPPLRMGLGWRAVVAITEN